jgi:hypothetical protein
MSSWTVPATSTVPTEELLPELLDEESGDQELITVESTELPIPISDDLAVTFNPSLVQEHDDDIVQEPSNVNSTAVVSSDEDECLAAIPLMPQSIDEDSILEELLILDSAVDCFQSETDVHKLNSIWEQQLFQAYWKLNSQVPILPWERGFAASVLSNNSSSSSSMFLRVPLPVVSSIHNQQVSKPEPKAPSIISEHSWQVVARRLANLPWRETEEKSRAFALARWRMIIQTDANSFGIGKQMLSDIMNLCTDEQLTSSIDDIFSMKATRTLLKRSSDLFKYISWCRQLRKAPFPLSESQTYQYIREKCMRFASSASSFRESISFAHGMLQLVGAEDVLNSVRIKGLCSKTKATKRPLQQAKVLTVRQVKHLESIVLSNADIQDRVMAGYCLVCLNSRARWNDIQFPTRLSEDRDGLGQGFYQIDVRIVKTSSTAEKKAMLLPVTGIIDGLEHSNWFDKWVNDRTSAGLPNINCESPLMPGVLVNGKWDKAPLSTSQASKWIRELLKPCTTHEHDLLKTSSHSLKATTLSWAAKYGLSIEDRKLLGYHVLDSANSTLHYSRDALSGPLRRMQEIYTSIRNGTFDPDATRSGYFSMPKLSVLDQSKASRASESSSSSSSSTSDSSDEVLSDEERVAVTNQKILNLPDTHKRRKLSVVKPDEVLYIHKRWRTLHIAPDEHSIKLTCGRIVANGYILIDKDQSFPYVKCKDCFGT